MEKQDFNVESLSDLVGSLIENYSKRKYDDQENEQTEKIPQHMLSEKISSSHERCIR